ncbi:MAG: hypothetical protein EA352_00100 [Gemmatimonadales bacterium]|nr:MAG: hypothetical protein EA352_00100 [Gemmatimonadales bacterium]
MCTRCVRFMNEMAQDPLLTVVERGNRSVIDTFFDEGLEGSPFHGNIVDICPVGALVSKDFLHKARAWDLDHTPSVCPNCSQGCNIDLHTRDNLVQRLRPRENPDVNQHWMCDFGRHRYEWMNEGGRMEAPVRQEADGSRAGGWTPVLESLSRKLGELEGTPVRAVASPRASNEDLAMLRSLVEALGGGEIVFRSPRAEDEVALPGFPTLKRRRDLVPNRRGAEILGMSRVGEDDGQGGLEDFRDFDGILVVLGDRLEDEAPGFGGNAALFLYLGTHAPEAAATAHYRLPVTTFAEQEGTFTNHEGRVQRFWPGLQAPGAARPAWLVLGALAAARSDGQAPTSPEEAFGLAGELAGEFSGLSFDHLGVRGALVNEPVRLPGN